MVRTLISQQTHSVINVDKLTYAGNLESLLNIDRDNKYCHEKVDICDEKALKFSESSAL